MEPLFLICVDQVVVKANGMDVSFATQLFINNQFVDSSSGKTVDIVNPTDESVSSFFFFLVQERCISVFFVFFSLTVLRPAQTGHFRNREAIDTTPSNNRGS